VVSQGLGRFTREDSILRSQPRGLRLLWLCALAGAISPGTALGQSSAPAIASPDATSAATDRDRALTCLTTAIAYEAGYEPVEGQQAVAQVILNRVRNPLYPKSVCGVVFAGSQRTTGCQFTFTCNGAIRRRLPDNVMAAARIVATSVLDGAVPDRIAGATHYHADYVSPFWAPSLVRVTKIGAHIFYRLPSAADGLITAAAYVPTGEPQIDLPTTTGRPLRNARASLATGQPRAFAPWGLSPFTTR
jgi:hypothetical protein